VWKSKRCEIILKPKTSTKCFLLDVCKSHIYSCEKLSQLSLISSKEEGRALKELVKGKISKYIQRE
jgi:hypothetical protein